MNEPKKRATTFFHMQDFVIGIDRESHVVTFEPRFRHNGEIHDSRAFQIEPVLAAQLIGTLQSALVTLADQPPQRH